MLAAPEYPLTNQTATGSVNIFDPNLQVPYSDTWTVGFQRALGQKSAIEIRYVGTRSRAAVGELQLQRGEHPRERLPRRVQARAGQPAVAHRGRLRRHADSPRARSPTAGRAPARRRCRSISRSSAAFRAAHAPATRARYTSSQLDELELRQSAWRVQRRTRSRRPARARRPASRAIRRGRPTRIAAGLPANFFRANPDMLGGANATGNRGFSKYNALQLQYRRRLSDGLQFDANYAFGRGYESTHYSFRVPRLFTRVAGRRRRRHARVQGHGRLRAAVRPGPPVCQRRSARWLDYFVGGWQVSGTTRIQTGRLVRSRQRPRGRHDRSTKCRSLFKMRKVSDTIVYCWPQDIIDETIKAYSTSATTPTGYGALGPPSGPVLRAGQRAGLHRDDQQRLRRLRRPRSSSSRDRWSLNFDLSLRKRIEHRRHGDLRVQPRRLQRAEPRELGPDGRRRQHDAGQLAGGPAGLGADDADRHAIQLVNPKEAPVLQTGASARTQVRRVRKVPGPRPARYGG